MMKVVMEDISDYLTSPDPDGGEWIKRKVLAMRWDLRRAIEEVEYVAEQYQLEKKYNSDDQEIQKLEAELRRSLQRSYNIAVQIREFT